MRAIRVVAGLLAVVFVLIVWRLSVLERGAPPHIDVDLGNGIPATLYLPGGDEIFFAAAERVERAPVPGVVVVHGFSSDRALMSMLARRIAQNGYAALAIDVSGHGQNRRAFALNFSRGSALSRDVKQAVDYLRALPYIDRSKVAVMGHSMGGGAVLDYAHDDEQLAASVMIAGGFQVDKDARVPNALFIFAEDDPEFIRDSSRRAAARLAGVETVELGKTYGDVGAGTAVQARMVAGEDHVSIVISEPPASMIIAWLDSAFGTSRSAPLSLDNPRRSLALAGLLVFTILLVAIGRTAGRLAPAWPRKPAGATAWLGLAIVTGALIVAMPLIGVALPAGFIPLVMGDAIGSWFFAAGVLVLAAMAATGRIDWPALGENKTATLLAALAALAVIYLMLVPLGATTHRLVPTPERLAAWAGMFVVLLPFFLGFELLVRRGGLLTSTLLGSAGRAAMLILLATGASAGIMPFVVLLLLPFLAAVFLMLEVFAASAYSVSANALLIALVESAWLGWLLAMFSPITFSF